MPGGARGVRRGLVCRAPGASSCRRASGGAQTWRRRRGPTTGAERRALPARAVPQQRGARRTTN
eukprot:3656262-Prymnesium_polylepis.1